MNTRHRFFSRSLLLLVCALATACARPIQPPGVTQATPAAPATPTASAAAAGETQPADPVAFVRKIDTSAQHIERPFALAVDGEGNVYLTDSSTKPRVLKYDRDGRFVLAWGEPGDGEGQFKFVPDKPEDGPAAGFIAVDKQGNVYVSDIYNFRVQKFDANGRFITMFGSKGSADDQFEPPGAGPVYVDDQGQIYVSTFPRVQKFDAQGRFLAVYGTAGDGDGQFHGAALSSTDRQGNLYVADLLNARIQKLDADGKFLLKWGSSGEGDGQFNWPVTVIPDQAGKLYVADNTNRIQIFDTSGKFLGKWSKLADGGPSLSGAIVGLALDQRGNIYVADVGSPSIVVYRPLP